MLRKSLTLHSLSCHKKIKLLLLIILLVTVTRLFWGRWSLLRNLTQIEQVLTIFDSALKEQDVELAYAQCLPFEYGGELSKSTVLNKRIYPFYLRTEIYYWGSRIRPIWTSEGIVLEANIIGRAIFDSPDAFSFRALLRKRDGRWYIVNFPPSYQPYFTFE